MRCIEIFCFNHHIVHNKWLTLTWDVLKWYALTNKSGRDVRLTLTWDVLKYGEITGIKKFNVININMRCIEITTPV